MADSSTQRVITFLTPKTVRRRYGRAALQILPEGDLFYGEIGKALDSYLAGNASAEEACWAFAWSRIRGHSPSFTWDEADLDRVLELVASVSEMPKLRSGEPGAVAEELVVARRAQTQAIRESVGRIARPPAAVSALASISRALVTTPHYKLLAAAASKQPTRLQKPMVVDALNGSAMRWITRQDHLGKLGKAAVVASPSDGLNGLAVAAQKHLAAAAGFTPPASQLTALSQSGSALLNSLRGLNMGPLFSHLQESAMALLRVLPTNWREMSAEENRRVVDLMTDEGLCLAWAPRVEIVEELVAAEGHEERCEILLRHRDEILEDIEEVLDDVSRPELELTIDAAREAINTYRVGHPKPAQSYAATAVGELVHEVLGERGFKAVRLKFREFNIYEDVPMRDFSFLAVGQTLARTLDNFDDAGEGFNRHLTLHRLGSFHNEPNLLSVLLLLSGLIRELDRFLQREESGDAVAA